MRESPLLEGTPDYDAAVSLGRSIPRAPLSGDRYPEESFRRTWKDAAAFGLFDLLIPAGPLNAPKVLSTLEGLGEGCENGGFLLALGAHCFGVGAPVAKFGHETHHTLLSSLRDGRVIAGLGATETDAGSDVMSLTTRFSPGGDHHVLHGRKDFVTNAGEADYFLVLATKDVRLHSRGVSAFIVPRTAKGLVVGIDEPRLGLHGCSIGSIRLENVVVPESALLGRLGEGAAVFRHAMLWERSLIVAAQVGVLRRQLSYCLSHATTRRQFGRPIGSNQYVAGRLVDLLTRYTTCRLLVRETVEKLARGALTLGEASLAKLYVTEAELASSLDAFRTHGGSGFMMGSPAAVDLGNALGGIVYSGTSDIQRVIVAAELGLVD